MRTIRIGLTGPIGCGKSTVAGMLAEHGAVVIDADRQVREVYEDAAVREAVTERFGPTIRTPDGSIDRRALARIVFDDAGALRDLEAIIHPAVRPRILAGIDAADTGVRRRSSWRPSSWSKVASPDCATRSGWSPATRRSSVADCGIAACRRTTPTVALPPSATFATASSQSPRAGLIRPGRLTRHAPTSIGPDRAAALEQHDRTSARITALGQSGERAASVNRIPRGQGAAPEEPSVRRRVEQQQHHVLEAGVPKLQGDAAVERLHVPRSGLGLNRQVPVETSDQGVPGAAVPGDRERHLGQKHQAGMEPESQSLDQCGVSGIPDRILPRGRTSRQIQADGDPESRGLLQRETRDKTAFDPARLGH